MVKLSGFNNLSKTLSCNLYAFTFATGSDQRATYLERIAGRHSGARLREVAREICDLIGANILAENIQDFEPAGASTMTLMSDSQAARSKATRPDSAAVALHLDKSHVTTHTYLDTSTPSGIWTFRVDIEVATCGEVIPLKALPSILRAFECDVVFVDYFVRGYTRLAGGKKIYNDRAIGSLQELIPNDILARYQHRQDASLRGDHIWQTKLMREPHELGDYLLDPGDLDHLRRGPGLSQLKKEMREVFHFC